MFSLSRPKPSTHRPAPARGRLALEALEERTLPDATPAATVIGGGGDGDTPPPEIPPPMVAITTLKTDIRELGLTKEDTFALLHKANLAFKEFRHEKLAQSVHKLTDLSKMVNRFADEQKVTAEQAAVVTKDAHFTKASFYDSVVKEKVSSPAEQVALDKLFIDLDTILPLSLHADQINRPEDLAIREIKRVASTDPTAALEQAAKINGTVTDLANNDTISTEQATALQFDVSILQQAIENPQGGPGSGGGFGGGGGGIGGGTGGGPTT
jgi:hypothetical protein